MTRQFYGLFVASGVVFSLVGCGGADNSLQQQKQLLEAMRLQQDTLVAIDQKQTLLREQEKAQEKRLKEIAERETALRNQATHNDAVLAEIKARQEQLKILADKVEEENRRTEYFAQLAMHRIPFLQRLAIEAAKVLEDTPGPREIEAAAALNYDRVTGRARASDALGARQEIRREYYYPLILKVLYDSHVHHIQADAAFEIAAYKLIDNYVLQFVDDSKFFKFGNDSYFFKAKGKMDRIREASATSSFLPELSNRRIPYLQRLSSVASNVLQNTEMSSEAERIIEDQVNRYWPKSVQKEIAFQKEIATDRVRIRKEYCSEVLLHTFYENNIQYAENDASCEEGAYRLIENCLKTVPLKESQSKEMMSKIREAMAESSK